MSSPMQRSLAYLRDDGWKTDIVERRVPYSNITRDLFGVGDILALKTGEKPLLVQATGGTGGNFAARQTKILAAPDLPLILEHFRVLVHCWTPRKIKRGGKAIRYVLREAEFTAESVAVQELGEVPA